MCLQRPLRQLGAASSRFAIGAGLCSLGLVQPAGADLPQAPSPPPANSYIAIGLPAVWERAAALLDSFGRGRDHECIDFALRAVGQPLKTIEVTSTGIEGATLLERSSSTPPCARTSHGASALTLVAPTDHDHLLRLIAPAEAFPDLSAGDVGQLVLISGKGPPIQSAITLRRRGISTGWSAVLWFVGIVIPSFATAWVGFIFARWQKRLDTSQQEASDLRAFTKAHSAELRRFFEGLYRNIIEDNAAEASENMRKELFELGIMGALPSAEMSTVVRALSAKDWQLLSKTLAGDFKDYRSLIMGEKTL